MYGSCVGHETNQHLKVHGAGTTCTAGERRDITITFPIFLQHVPSIQQLGFII